MGAVHSIYNDVTIIKKLQINSSGIILSGFLKTVVTLPSRAANSRLGSTWRFMVESWGNGVWREERSQQGVIS